MHRLCFVDNWLLHPISKNWYFTLCDKNLEIDKPDFQYGGENEGYVYVSMYVHMYIYILVQYG